MRSRRGKWAIWVGVVLIVVLVVALFLYFALKGPNYDDLYSGEILPNPAEGLSVEEAVAQFDESFVYYLLVSIKAYNLHDPPLSDNKPKIEFLIDSDVYNAVVDDGEILVERGQIDNEDMTISTTTEEAVLMVQDENYIQESFISERSWAELKAEKSTLFAKGYLGLYTELTGQSITGGVVRIYLE